MTDGHPKGELLGQPRCCTNNSVLEILKGPFPVPRATQNRRTGVVPDSQPESTGKNDSVLTSAGGRLRNTKPSASPGLLAWGVDQEPGKRGLQMQAAQQETKWGL